MKRIVVPTDFSDCSISALKVAAILANKMDAVISLVHTYAVPVYGFTSGHVMFDGEELGKIKAEIKEELQRLAAQDFIKKHRVETFLLPDYSIEQIVEHDVLKKADFIVMGTHGTSGFKEIIGSNTEKLIRKAKCPVLSIREGAEKTFDLKNIVFASTFYGEVYERFDKVMDFAKLFDSKIHLLYVNTPSDFMTTDYSDNVMQSFKEKFNLKDATLNVYNEKTVEDGIIRFSRRINADLIVMETHGRTGINHVMLGSIAEDVANHIGIPVLTYHIKEMPKPTGHIFPDMR